jgi:hypothetical protein
MHGFGLIDERATKRFLLTKTFIYCTRCANGLSASDDMCAACGHSTIDANRVIHLQAAGARQNRKRPRGAAAPSFDPSRRPQPSQEPPFPL